MGLRLRALRARVERFFSNLTKMELRYYCFVTVITDLFSLYVLFNVGHVIHSREFFHLKFVQFPCVCTYNL